MNLTRLIDDLRIERAQLRHKLKLVESTMHTLEALEHNNLLETKPNGRRATLRDQVYSVLQDAGPNFLRPRQIADLIHHNNVTVGQILSAMRHGGELEYDGHAGYRLPVCGQQADGSAN